MFKNISSDEVVEGFSTGYTEIHSKKITIAVTLSSYQLLVSKPAFTSN